MFRRFIVLSMLVATCLPGASTRAGEIAGWKQNPAIAYEQASTPIDWSDRTHHVWSTPMPDRANSTPLVIGDKVFTTAEPFRLICVNADSGEVLWQKDNPATEALEAGGGGEAMTAAEKAVFDQKQARITELEEQSRGMFRRARRDPQVREQLEAVQTEIAELKNQIAPQLAAAGVLPRTHDTNGYASSSPATDGENIYVVFGNGVAACYDMDGNRNWIKLIQPPVHQWGFSATPQVVDGVAVFLINDLIACDAKTGEELWRIKKQHSFGSPTVADLGNGPFLITPTGLFVDPKTGDELGAVENVLLEYNVPLFVDGKVYFIYENAAAFELSQDDDGNVSASEIWSTNIRGDRHYASPVIKDGLIYTISRREDVTVINAADGAIVHEGSTDLGLGRGSMYSSPIIAADRVYYTAEDGRIQLYKTGSSGEKAEQIRIGALKSTPVIANNRVYIRTQDALLCIAASS